MSQNLLSLLESGTSCFWDHEEKLFTSLSSCVSRACFFLDLAHDSEERNVTEEKKREKSGSHPLLRRKLTSTALSSNCHFPFLSLLVGSTSSLPTVCVILSLSGSGLDSVLFFPPGTGSAFFSP